MSRTLRRTWPMLLATVLFAGIGVAPIPAAAQDAQALARDHYQKGKTLYDQGKFAEALVEFQAAYDAKPHPTVLKSIAECKVQTGDIPGALEVFDKYLADPTVAEKDKAPIKARRDQVAAMMASLEVSSTPAGAGIMLNGSMTGKTTPATFELGPGDHEMTLNIEGYEPLVKSVKLESGKKTTVAVDFAKEGKAVAVAPKADSSKLIDPFATEGEGEGETEEGAKEEETATEGPPPAFWVCAAVAGVGLVSGTVFGTMALGDEEDYKDDPTQEKLDAGERNALIADVSFGLAIAAAVVGAVILFTDDGGEAEASASARKFNVVPVAGGDAVGASASVTF